MTDKCCPMCDDGEGNCAFPYYGCAPHDCGYKHGAPFGKSKEHPAHRWPANFVYDDSEGPPTPGGYPGCGTYTHCLHCGRGQ